MRKLRLGIVLASVMVGLISSSGIAWAGMSWCDLGCPPPMESGKVANPGHNPHGMPTPQFQNSNGKFVNNLPPGYNR
jgi:hypothetical protein